MRYGALVLLFAGAVAAVGIPAGATGNNDANPHHTQTGNDSCSAPKGSLGPTAAPVKRSPRSPAAGPTPVASGPTRSRRNGLRAVD